MHETMVERYRAARRHPSCTVLEGFHALKHALRFGAEIVEVACRDRSLVAALAEGLAPDVGREVLRLARDVDAATFQVLSPAPVHTGVIAIARRPEVDEEAAFADPGPAPLVLLEDTQSPHNVGASIRVAAAAGAAGLFVTGRVDPWSPAALRAAAGLAWALPVAHLFALPPIQRPLIALDPEGDDVRLDTLPERALLAFGTERGGLSEDLLRMADRRVRIPMRDGVSSLNLATAVSAVLYSVSPVNRPTD